MDLKPALLLLLPVLILPWVILLFVRAGAKKSAVKNFMKLCEKYGLESGNSGSSGSKSLPSVMGTYRSRNVKIESFDKDPAGRKKTAPRTIMTIECSNNSDFTFTVVRKNKYNVAAFGGDSTLTDDEEFDSKYIITTNNAEKLRSIFDFNTRFKLDQVHKLGFDGVIDLRGNFLFYSEKGLITGDESLMRFELVLHELCDIADVLKYN